jgi:thiosulfate/3-mercaptopyruvate sulfurtransferase
MMATRDSIEILLGKLGIRSDKKIILYDYKGGCDAARFWWILRCYGHHDVEILEGDERVWEMTYEITNKQEHRFSTDYKFPNEIDYSLSADLTGLISGMKRKAFLLDVRTKEEYTGERMKDGAFRAGHIPGAIFCPWTEAINAKGNKKLKSKRELAKMYANLGLSKDDEIVVYCHSGVRSAHTAFVLTEILGYTNVKNYDGSWIEYSFNKDLPIETGGLEKPKIEPLPLSNSVWMYPLIIVLIAVIIAMRRKRKR